MEDIAALIDEKQRRISELSVGISYDVLLCSSTDEESVGYSMTLYNRMRSEGINVFYPDVTLKTTAKSEWEPYLFSAVNSAKALILTVTDPDILNDIMVMNLCGRFMSVDMSGRAVIPVLFGVTPGELPPELSKFQELKRFPEFISMNRQRRKIRLCAGHISCFPTASSARLKVCAPVSNRFFLLKLRLFVFCVNIALQLRKLLARSPLI